MFTLLSRGIRAAYRRCTILPTVLLLGLDNAGKTTLFYGLIGEPQSIVAPTLGFRSERTKVLGQTILFYDLGGNISIRDYWSEYIPEAHAIVFVVDSADAERFPEAARALREVAARAASKVVLVLMNKQDLGAARTPEEVAAALEVDRLSERCSVQFYGVSALALAPPPPPR
eukprot:gnl/Chilomastix_cuspidata/3179.p1 GENE.gnl/Chilomastix_cuspidata/3179~~gnl/Chilomastix_cuspidata/3179.p1  ORF type:complete len:172 (+),score=48.59 gnl/Chilomastix_cuspidata/3179:105-620(+)